MCRALNLSRFVLAVFLLVSLPWNAVASRISKEAPCKFPAIYNFGDTNSDTGGISAAFIPVPPPYGESFFQRPAGRYSDGRLIIDFIAEHLGMPYLSSYLDSLSANFRHGANFAAGESTICKQNYTMFEGGISPFSLDIQTINFYQFKLRTYELYNQAKSSRDKKMIPDPKEFSRALYTLDIGQNDLSAAFCKLTIPQLRVVIPYIVNQFTAAVTRLYSQGARTFWIHNTGPIGCMAAATIRNSKPGFRDKIGCIQDQNRIAIEFNKQLKATLVDLRTELADASLVYVDIYSAKDNLIRNAKNYGFREPLKICCGIHDDKTDVWCGQRKMINGTEVMGSSCGTPETYISWDGVHFSEAANHWIANVVLNGSYSDPPLPISHACLANKKHS